MVRFENVSFGYVAEHAILRELSFELSVGTFHFLTGASGAGKSSLLKMIYMALVPSTGRLTLFNRYVHELKRHEKTSLRRRIGVVFQDFRLLSHLTVWENVALPLWVDPSQRGHAFEHAQEALQWADMGDYLERYPQTLSGGQQQRVAIVRAIINKPDLLIADEPTGNVDDKSTQRFFHLFEELHKQGTTVIVATHDSKLLQRYQHRILCLHDGTLTEQSQALFTPAPLDEPLP
ncbi:MAG: ATP-binding cassette domain-containing protein [Alphaproteobacteria bacterium GM202ARS2]|nr:ATP-binding cassette domain-containing protein [Alphaproteobacteria bacterium GM202ARS2]